MSGEEAASCIRPVIAASGGKVPETWATGFRRRQAAAGLRHLPTSNAQLPTTSNSQLPIITELLGVGSWEWLGVGSWALGIKGETSDRSCRRRREPGPQPARPSL